MEIFGQSLDGPELKNMYSAVAQACAQINN